MNEEIIGKVAAILSDKDVVINIGKTDGVTVGMVFGIKLTIPDIVDPDDDKNVLSGFFYTKAKIKIESVSERMSFASIQPKRTISTSLLPSNWPSSTTFEYPAIASKKLVNEDD